MAAVPEESVDEAERERLELRARLLGSLLGFTEVFFRLKTGRSFVVSRPQARASHHIEICRALVKVFRGEITRLIINVPPRYGKTTLLINFVAWALARVPQSNFLYVSYSHSLAKKQTQMIRDIMMMPNYYKLFDVHISDSSSAKDEFETTVGGSIYAAGAGGTITGRGAGIFDCDSFGGAIIIDDIHKPNEVASDTIRNGIIDWYYNTMQSRLNNGEKTPIIFIGQRLHEDDLPAHLLRSNEWDSVVLKSLDDANNALNPKSHSKIELLNMQEREPYTFASQYQQDPQPAGGGVFKKDWFILFDEEPEILATFITADTAETDKTYNDATVFSFWGIYKIKHGEIETDIYGIHWIDCVELWIEPKDLENEFMQFYASAMRHSVKPKLAAIEKKSTGVTLISVLKGYQGLEILEIERTSKSGSKGARFLEIQPYVSTKRISFLRNAKHTEMCIEHCSKITANNTHRRDDICDSLYDAVKIALIDKTLLGRLIGVTSDKTKKIVKIISAKYSQIERLRRDRKW